MERLTRGQAIRKFFLECMGGSVHEVRLCTAPKCPLFRYRLGHEKKDETIGHAHENES